MPRSLPSSSTTAAPLMSCLVKMRARPSMVTSVVTVMTSLVIMSLAVAICAPYKFPPPLRGGGRGGVLQAVSTLPFTPSRQGRGSLIIVKLLYCCWYMFNKISCNHSYHTFFFCGYITCEAVQIYAKTGCLRRPKTLCDKTCNYSGQCIPCPCGCHPRITGRGDMHCS